MQKVQTSPHLYKYNKMGNAATSKKGDPAENGKKYLFLYTSIDGY